MPALRLSRTFVLAAALISGRAMAQPAPPRLRVVEIAGDSSLPVFDNAIEAVGARLAAAGDSVPSGTARLSAARPALSRGARPATLAQTLKAIAAMKPDAGQGCLVFATSHGVRQAGLYLSLRNEVLTPQALDRALLQGCGNAPTAVIVSACFSGSFARPPMTRANRVILTAARPDRTSFGCQAGRVYTVYDECLVGALDREHGWRPAYAAIQDCVQTEERRENAVPSMPQAWFGAASAGVPWP